MLADANQNLNGPEWISPLPVAMEKEAVRLAYRQRVQRLDRAGVARQDAAVLRNLTQLLTAARTCGSVLGLYAAMANDRVLEPELGTDSFGDLRPAYPRFDSGPASMEYCLASRETLQPGAFGIPMPAGRAATCQPDIVCVPGIAFDGAGFRIGHGAGYYDRYFAQYPGVLRIGVAYEWQVVADCLHEDHDLPVDWLVTEQMARAVSERAYKQGERQ